MMGPEGAPKLFTGAKCCGKELKLSPRHRIWAIIASLAGTTPGIRTVAGEKDIMDGIHLLGEWYGCNADMPEITNADALRMLCVRLATASGMTVVGDSFYQFSPAGVTGTVLL